MAKDGEKRSNSLHNDKVKSKKTFNGRVNTPSDQADESHQRAHNNFYLEHPSTTSDQEHQASYATDFADDTASAGWSHLETQGYGTTSQGQDEIHTYNTMNETYTYELERWVYETSDANLTFAERLQKRKWEADKVERS